jgi:hypothetical protein
MYRALIVLISFFTLSIAHATIYQWTDQQGQLHYSQTPPPNKSIESKKITIRNSTVTGDKPHPSIQDSANEIAKSNAERKAANEKIQQDARANRAMQERCSTSKKNLAELDYGGNRLYKDADGNYSRFSAEDKNQQREQLNAFINENCR